MPNKKLQATSLMKLFMYSMLFIFSSGFPLEALAFFDPPAGDKSIKLLLEPIFGNLFTSGGDGSGSPLATLIQTFNGAVLLIGGVLAAYTLLAGTMATAHDGEMLGKKWSSMWVPIRTAVGTAMCIPLGSGFCAAQLLIGWLGMQGIGLGSLLWGNFVEGFVTVEGMQPSGMAPRSDALAQNLLRSHVCMEAVNYIHNSGTPTEKYQFDEAFSRKADGNGFSYGGNRSISKTICGQVSFPSKSDLMDDFKESTTNLSNLGLSVSFSSPELVEQAIASHKSAFEPLDAAMKSLAQQIIQAEASGGGLPSPSAYESAVKEHQKAITTFYSTNAGAVNNAFDAIKASATADGWILAGAWFVRLSVLQDSIHRAINAGLPNAQSSKSSVIFGYPESSRFKTAYVNFTRQASARYTGLMEESTPTNGDMDMLANESDGFFSWVINTLKMISGDFIKNLFEKLAKVHIYSLLESLIELADSKHPIVFAKDTGNIVMTATVGLATVTALVGTGAGMFGTFLAFLSPLLATVGGALAISLSVYVPMLPFLIFLGVVLGWLFFIVEAVMAAPLWAVMHLHPDGGEWAGRGGPGYMLLISLILKPALIIIGFCSAIVVMIPLFHFINTIFFPAFKASLGIGGFGLGTIISFFGGIGVYLYFFLSLMNKTLSLTHHVPDHILRWIGGQGSSLSGSAQEASKGGEQGAAIGGAIAGSQAAQAMQGARQAHQLNASNKMQKEQASEARNNAVSSAERKLEAAESRVSMMEADQTGQYSSKDIDEAKGQRGAAAAELADALKTKASGDERGLSVLEKMRNSKSTQDVQSTKAAASAMSSYGKDSSGGGAGALDTYKNTDFKQSKE